MGMQQTKINAQCQRPINQALFSFWRGQHQPTAASYALPEYIFKKIIGFVMKFQAQNQATEFLRRIEEINHKHPPKLIEPDPAEPMDLDTPESTKENPGHPVHTEKQKLKKRHQQDHSEEQALKKRHKQDYSEEQISRRSHTFC